MILQKISGHFCQFWNPRARMMASYFRRIFVKLWPAVYPSRMAPFGLKLWENAFQTIPNISFFDAEKKFWQNFLMKIIVKKKIRRKIDKLPVFAELWIFGRNRQMRLEKLPPKFWFSTLYDFWRRGKRDSFCFFPDFRPQMTSTLFVFWLEDTCVPDDKISLTWWIVASCGAPGW